MSASQASTVIAKLVAERDALSHMATWLGSVASDDQIRAVSVAMVGAGAYSMGEATMSISFTQRLIAGHVGLIQVRLGEIDAILVDAISDAAKASPPVF